MSEPPGNSQPEGIRSRHDSESGSEGVSPGGVHRPDRGHDEPEADASRGAEAGHGRRGLDLRGSSDQSGSPQDVYRPEDDPGALALPASIVDVEAARTVSHHSGLLPPPDQLEDYERRFPGLKAHIVSWTDKQLAMAQRSVEAEAGAIERLTRAEAFSVIVGTIVVGVIAVGLVVATIVLAVVDAPTPAVLVTAVGAAITAVPAVVSAARGRQGE